VGGARSLHQQLAEERSMISIVRAVAKLCVVIIVLAAFQPIVPSQAENFAFVSANGTGFTCTAAAPCDSVLAGLLAAPTPKRITCINGSAQSDTGVDFAQTNEVVDIDCPQGTVAQLTFSGATATVRIRHLTFRNAGYPNLLAVGGSGTLIFEDCVFTDSPGVALDIEPNGALKLVIRNSRMSNNASGILLKPAGGGSIKARLDHVTITNNGGGGIKIDTTNGPVTTDIDGSVISDNGGNGVNAVAGSSQNIVSIKNSVIAGNGAAGVQANGVNAGVLMQTTLLDQNTAGATSVVGGGNIFTYGNNSIVGSAGSGFNHTAGLQ
jgi:hypothetical protein